MNVNISDVRSFWNSHPLCASKIPHPLGTRMYFSYYDHLREDIEDIRFSYRLHEYRNFKGKKVLDVGCGNGYVLGKYAYEGAIVFGVDITSTAIELCKKRFQYTGLSGKFLESDAQRLPFDDNFFDCVCSMGVLHHVPDTSLAVDEIYRVLKPGGRIIVMFYHKNSALYRIKFLLDSLRTSKSRQRLVNEVDGIGNPKGFVYSKAELKQLFHNFKNIKMFIGYLSGGMILPRGGRFIPKTLLRFFKKSIGWNLYAKGYKPDII